MLQSLRWLVCAVLVATAGISVLPLRGLPQVAAHAAATESQTDQSSLLRQLEQRIEMKYFQVPDLKLKDFLGLLYQIQDKRGAALPIIVDIEAFRGDDPDFSETYVYDTPVKFPPFPPEMTIATALSMAVQKIPGNNATFVVLADHILITTFARTAVEAKLKEKVRGVYEKVSLESAVRDLADQVGVTITIDVRAAEKAKRDVSASFRNDISLAGALRVLTEMADLKVAVVDGAIFITTPANAEVLRKEGK